jgi:hypothetical protein
MYDEWGEEKEKERFYVVVWTGLAWLRLETSEELL